MIYRGMGFRSFQLMFLFSPKSHQEADQINSINLVTNKRLARDVEPWAE